ncbi:cytochrome P450 [Roridomyces roridus]|uniref:Cytochrome P450 n=1 Tax=Roridomyces roridus TaxID=1738132 RepID=A0AAD7BE80_9AGAR|nr:cytochrome P450 [Roridomyces roridus]
MEVPPGIEYLARVLPTTLLPSAATFIFLTRLLPLLNFAPLPLWARLLGAVLALPVTAILGYIYQERQEEREAAAWGAARIPLVPDEKWGGFGFTLIERLKENFLAGYPGDFVQDWCEQCQSNTVMTKILFEREITTVEPEYIKVILATEFDKFCKDPNSDGILHSLLGSGIFHRGLARPFFSRERISDFAMFDRHTQKAIGLMKKRLAEGHPLDFQDLVARFTLDSATEFLCERSVDSMAAGLPYPPNSPLADSASFVNHPSSTFVTSFMASQTLSVMRTPYGSRWPLWEFWTDRVKPHRKVVNDFIEPILNRTLEAKKQDKQVIRDAIFNILIAGRDTTAATLTLNEILEIVGKSRMPTYDDIRKMRFLRAFINETLRLYPPVPFDIRTSRNATTFPPLKPGDQPLYIPARTHCRYSVFRMHRRTDLWGPDAELTLQIAHHFDPDRFLDERVRKYLTANPFIFLPFNAGPRICIGQLFAYNEASFFLIRLLQNFSSFHLAPEAQPDWSKPPPSWKESCEGTKGTDKIMFGLNLTMYVKGGLWVTMDEAP